MRKNKRIRLKKRNLTNFGLFFSKCSTFSCFLWEKTGLSQETATDTEAEDNNGKKESVPLFSFFIFCVANQFGVTGCGGGQSKGEEETTGPDTCTKAKFSRRHTHTPLPQKTYVSSPPPNIFELIQLFSSTERRKGKLDLTDRRKYGRVEFLKRPPMSELSRLLNEKSFFIF